MRNLGMEIFCSLVTRGPWQSRWEICPTLISSHSRPDFSQQHPNAGSSPEEPWSQFNIRTFTMAFAVYHV